MHRVATLVEDSGTIGCRRASIVLVGGGADGVDGVDMVDGADMALWLVSVKQAASCAQSALKEDKEREKKIKIVAQ